MNQEDYRWSCRYCVPKGYSSLYCDKQKPGHQFGTAQANMMGGSQYHNWWPKLEWCEPAGETTEDNIVNTLLNVESNVNVPPSWVHHYQQKEMALIDSVASLILLGDDVLVNKATIQYPTKNITIPNENSMCTKETIQLQLKTYLKTPEEDLD
eukprot:4143765-Ditylum_brightwellii.AAC.1